MDDRLVGLQLLESGDKPRRVAGQLHAGHVGERLALAADGQLHELRDERGEDQQDDAEHGQEGSGAAVALVAVATAMAECFGSRPVAKAFGAGSSTMYTRGFGSPAAMQSPSTTLWSRAYSTGSAGRARLIASATESDFQYASAEVTSATTIASTTPAMPNCSRVVTTTPTTIAKITNAAIMSAERRRFWVTWSY